jgi:carbon storage regulator
MLVLSRKVGEVLVIGDNIRLTVVAVCRSHVRLGIAAPPDVSIWREELCQQAEDLRTSAVRPATAEAEP